jgi:hypothetical protein
VVEIHQADGIVAAGEVAGVLAQLVDRSMVTVTGNRRYRLLETVGAYALARLTEAGEVETVRDRHCLYHLSLAEACVPGVFGPGQRSCLEQLDTEHGNFHRALEHAICQEAADRLSGLGRIAMLRDEHDTARELHERARRLAAEHGFKPGEVYAGIGLGQSARRAGAAPNGGQPKRERPAGHLDRAWPGISRAVRKVNK